MTWALVVLVVLALTVGAVYLIQPQLFQQGVRVILSLTGQGEASAPGAPNGPDFDTPQASRLLGEVAQSLGPCLQAEGPDGKGRARVLFAPSGRAQSVRLDAPYANTPVGACIEKRFMKVSVPNFGGQPVLVNKSFTLVR